MHSSKTRRRRLLSFAAGLGVSLAGVGGVVTTPALAAKDVALVSGAFRRSLSVDDLAYLAETGKPRGLMVDILRLSNQNPEDVAKLLDQELSFDELQEVNGGVILTLLAIATIAATVEIARNP